MKYIKTRTGIYERPKDGYIRDNKVPCMIGFSIVWDDIIKEADNPEELFDCYVDYCEEDDSHLTSNDKPVRRRNHEIYGAVWTKGKGKNEEPILKSVAKMNENGGFDLLYVYL